MKTYPCQGCGKTLPLLRRDEEVEAVRVVGISRAYRLLGRGSGTLTPSDLEAIRDWCERELAEERRLP